MSYHHDRNFPGENESYREARNKLLDEEIALRAQIEKVAEQRRKLPLGGKLKENYLLEEIDPITGSVRKTEFQSLFSDNKNTLIVYSFMYGDDWERPCNGCTPYLDNINPAVAQVGAHINYAVIGAANPAKLQEIANRRNWKNLRLLSAANSSFLEDYLSRYGKDDSTLAPLTNVFVRKDNEIYHSWGSELLFVEPMPNSHPRHSDLTWSMWGLLDLTPEGRGDNHSTVERF